MESLLREQSCADFAALLASPAPAPGGGGAAALMGALAAALASMAASLTAGRKKYASRREALLAAAARAEDLSRALLEQIDADAAGFLPLAAAYALPKDAPETAETLRRATLTACRAPFAMLKLCRETALLLERLRGEVSPLLLSDLGCGAAACRAAAECAVMNVTVNTRTLPGDGEAEALAAESREILREILPPLEDAVSAAL